MADQTRPEEVAFVHNKEDKAVEGVEETVNITTITMESLQTIRNVLARDFAKGLSSLRSVTRNGMEQLTVLGATLKDQIREFRAEFDVNDWLSVEGLMYLTLLSVVILCVFSMSLNIYRKIRYAIPASVNCWFCNSNSKVLYSLRDTWTCPKCHQYNGFTSDGNYNKRIPAQFIEALNRPVRGYPPTGHQTTIGTNGLCSQCNLNQVLKVFQLASFQPVNERNFDAEIDAEQKRLEQLYDICSQCKVLVEEIIQRPPEKQQLPMRKSNVNRVTPQNPPSTECAKGATKRAAGFSRMREPTGPHSDLLKDISNSSLENDSDDSFLSLDNLKIGSKNRNRSFSTDLLGSSSPPYFSPSPPLSVFSMPVYNNNNRNLPSHYGMNRRLSKDPTPLWKDYPLIQGGISPTYSVIDSTLNCSINRPSPYIPYSPSAMTSQTTQFNFQSSTAGSVFGGNKPLISPPRFSTGNSARSFGPYVRYGSYYDISANQPPGSVRNGMSIGAPVVISQHYFTNPISRTSSQSSGFVSQQGGLATPPPGTPAPSTSASFYVS